MAKEALKHPLRGIIPPMITPLLEPDKLDLAGIERLVEHILQGGVHGLFILGTTGEAPSLSYSLRLELIEKACQQVAGRVPVLVGITDTVFINSINLAKKAEDSGAQAVVLAPPYYFPAGQPELLEYLEHLTERINLPLFLYNMPVHTKFSFEPDTVVAAAELPHVCGLKDSSGNMTYFHYLRRKLKNKKDFSLLVGPEELLAEALFSGADGGVNGGANFYPELYVNLYNAMQQNDWQTAKELHAKIIDISANLYHIGHYPGSSYLKGIKCALSVMGICADFMAEPFHSFREPERQKVKKYLQKIGITH